MPRSKFIQPEPKYVKEPDPAYLSRLNRTREAYRRVNFSYNPDNNSVQGHMELQQNYKEQRNVDLQRTYFDCVQEKLLSIQRILLPQKDMFENENGELVSQKSAIVYKVMVEILDENAKKLGYNKVLELEHNEGQCIFTIGKYQRPSVQPISFDWHRNITDMEINGHFWTYYIPDNKTTLDSLIKRYGKPAKSPTVAIAKVSGSDPYSAVQTVINEEDFYSGKPVQDIILGSRMNLPVEPAIEWQKKKAQLIKSGKFTELQLSKISADNIVKMLQEIEVSEQNKKK